MSSTCTSTIATIGIDLGSSLKVVKARRPSPLRQRRFLQSCRRASLRQVRFRKPAEVAPVRLKVATRAKFRKVGDEPHGGATMPALDDGWCLVGGRHRGWHAVP